MHLELTSVSDFDSPHENGCSPKLDTTKPSRVVHIRNIPNDITETEIVHLGIPFGKVTNVLVLKYRNQAFLEMSDETAAAQMVTYFSSGAAQFKGRAIFVQFSNHKELKTDQTHSNFNASAQAALQAAQVLSGADVQGGPNTVLRVVIEHMLYPVTLDVLQQVFSRVGKVLKIVTFTKNDLFQALIQYPDVVMSQAAKIQLDGQNIYNSCCTLRVEFSKLTNLNVKYNNDKSRDFTNPTLPSGDPTLDSPFVVGGTASGNMLSHFSIPSLSNSLTGLFPQAIGTVPFPGMGILSGPLGLASSGVNRFLNHNLGSVLLVSNLNENTVSPDALFTLFGVYGDVLRVKILFNKKDNALIQMSEPQQAALALSYLDRVRVWDQQIRVMPSKHQTVQMPKEGQPDAGLTKDYSSSGLHRFKKPGSKNYQNIYPPSSTLHLSNIPVTVSETFLRNAFDIANFDVRAFKFFPKREHLAQPSSAGSSGGGGGSYGGLVDQFEPLNNGTLCAAATNGRREHKMALIQLGSIDEAIMALIKMHNYPLGELNHLRVSFSKSTI